MRSGGGRAGPAAVRRRSPEVVERARERLRRTRPEVPPQPDRLVQIGTPPVEHLRRADVGELGLAPADAHARDQPTIAQGVERGQLLRQEHGVALRDDDHAGPELEVAMAAPTQASVATASKTRPVLGLGRPWHEDVVRRPDGLPAEARRRRRAGLDRLTARARTGVAQDQAELHDVTMLAQIPGRQMRRRIRAAGRTRGRVR